MAIRLTRGTKEHVIIDVDDLSDQITDLSLYNPRFEVLDALGAFFVDPDTPVSSAVGLRVYCLIDTNTAANLNPTPWPLGTYELYLKFTTPPEEPRLGPHEIIIVA